MGFGLPVLITPQCNLPEAIAAGAAIEIGPDENAIEAGLLSLFKADRRRLARMAESARELVRTRFDWDLVAGEFEGLYQDCMTGPAG